MSIRGVKYVSFHEETGYGIAAARAMLSLHDAGVPVTWLPLVPGREWKLGFRPFRGRAVGDSVLDFFCNRSIEYDVVVAHTVPEYYPLIAEREQGKTIVGSTVWETSKVPAHWPALLSMPDHLIVPCVWNREVFRGAGIISPIDVVPHPLRTESVPPRRPIAGVRDGDMMFYTIGTWTPRKALDLTIEAFMRAFRADDPVVLVVKTTSHDLSAGFPARFFASTARRLAAIARRHRTPARVRLVTEQLSNEQMLALHARGDCFVSLCRSEGWGLGAYDAAGYGTPVVITGYGGHLDYLPRDYPYLVNHEIVPVHDSRGRRSYSADQRWAEPDVDHGAHLMRDVFEQRDTARAVGMQLGRSIRHDFSADAVSRRLVESLNRAAPRE